MEAQLFIAHEISEEKVDELLESGDVQIFICGLYGNGLCA